MTSPLVLKFGGDALATPERIAAAARRVVLRRPGRPLVVVASARRGVTDRLFGLVEQVRDASGHARPLNRAALAAVDRAVTSGEIVAASLLALALEQLGVPAVVLDARESGILSDGTPGEATVVGVRPARVERLIGRNVVPVVTGFQGWHRGRLTALGRGGSDITAVALAGALGAAECELVKDPGALHTADPKLVPGARPIPRASHRFVTDLSGAGARVIHHAAAASAEREGRSLRFTSLVGDGEPATIVTPGEPAPGAHAVVLVAGRLGLAPADDHPAEVATVTVVSDGGPTPRDELFATVARTGVRVLRAGSGSHGFSFLVPDAESGILLRALHTTLDVAIAAGDEGRRMYAGHR